MEPDSSEKNDHPTLERRSEVRKPVRVPGMIKYGPIGTKIPCTVHDLTQQGAGLSVATTFGLPDVFELAIDGFFSSRNCRVVRTDSKMVGVSFK